MITPDIKNKVVSIVNQFETGTPEGDYSSISIFDDGKVVRGKRTVQLTYGKSQTTEQGNLLELLEMYYAQAGDADKREVLPIIEKMRQRIPLIPIKLWVEWTLKNHDHKAQLRIIQKNQFLSTLFLAGMDPIMKTVQDQFFDKRYWQPAYEWYMKNEFTHPLSMLIAYDTQVHSGGMEQDYIYSGIRNRFSEVPPARGGREKVWMRQYVQYRDIWLNGRSELLKKTDYRTNSFMYAINAENWNLDMPFGLMSNDERETKPYKFI